jgi:hypothetical protein
MVPGAANITGHGASSGFIGALAMNCSVTPFPCRPVIAGCFCGVLLLAWNGVLSGLASPFVLQHRFDAVQYQLLVRNRLHGHYETGDEAHAVHAEGCHPLWRPGLVWVEEGLARCFGSVGKGAAAASALGTTLVELALLGLIWRCYGRKTCLFLLCPMLVPEVSGPFLEFAVGEGPEVWAAAASVAGLAILVEGVHRRSDSWAITAGAVAGAAEWFRTGNLLLFAVPCALYAVIYLGQRDHRGARLLVGALLAWVGMAALGGQIVPSAVNKTIANLWACRTDLAGPWLTEELPDGSYMTSSLLSYSLVPGTAETYLDHSLRSSRGRSTWAFCREHAGEIRSAYFERLGEAVTSGFRGLRQRVGAFVLALFGLQLLFSLVLSREWHTLALAGAALAHYLGPVVLIAGNEPSHYLLVAYPLFVGVATRGAVVLSEFRAWRGALGCVRDARGVAESARIQSQGSRVELNSGECSYAIQGPHATRPSFVLGLVVLPIAFPSLLFYQAEARQLRTLQKQAFHEQVALDALELGGRRVACRNMAWFVDRDVLTVFLPYATVPELENYVRAHSIDGILIWEDEPTGAFRANPYGSPLEFGRALQDSGRFDVPQVSGAWRWYPVRHTKRL